MPTVLLGDGREVDIQIWNFEQLKSYLAGFPPQADCTMKVKGFQYLGPSTPTFISEQNSQNYSDEIDLSPLEIQEERHLPSESYHMSLAATYKNDLCGILICPWVKDDLSFWRYRIHFIDVNARYSRRGVATHLIGALNHADFLKSKILQRGIVSSEDGRSYSNKVFRRLLRGENYALIPCCYRSKPPTEPGIYDFLGNRITQP